MFSKTNLIAGPVATTTKFEIAGFIPPVEGQTYGQRWNGWACPYFTKQQGMAVVAAWNKECGTFSGVSDDMTEREERPCARFDEETNMFRFYDGDSLNDFKAETINGVEVWGIGAFGWTWEEVGS